MRRVVVTGMGLVTPLGVGLDHNWTRLTNGESGAAAIETFDVSDLPAKIAAPVPRGDGSNGGTSGYWSYIAPWWHRLRTAAAAPARNASIFRS